jgi:hypothetical protein
MRCGFINTAIVASWIAASARARNLRRLSVAWLASRNLSRHSVVVVVPLAFPTQYSPSLLCGIAGRATVYSDAMSCHLRLCLSLHGHMLAGEQVSFSGVVHSGMWLLHPLSR